MPTLVFEISWGPPPRPQGGESKGYTVLIAEWTDRNWSAVETILGHASMGKKPACTDDRRDARVVAEPFVADKALRGAQKK